MQSLTLYSRIGKDGILKLQTPIGMPNTDVEVILVVSPLKKSSKAKIAKKHPGWPPEFFSEIVGGWQGEPLVREPQGDYETRDELK
ncbi:hypothetical protein GW781_14750 [bacterium]|nr:hypothetical protein [bacterium]PJH76261.1 MAG: hypothetical protein CO064_02220 [Anaerolineae bacterium CG_4_9_14_0_8_um_filter_58_9]